MAKAEITKEEFSSRVTALMVKGFSKKDIAGKLGISLREIIYCEQGEHLVTVLLLRSLEYLELQLSGFPDIGAKKSGRPKKVSISKDKPKFHE